MKKLLITFLVVIFPIIKINYLFACFGPELIVGYEEKNLNSFYAASVFELYIREKTGIDVKLLPLNNQNLDLIEKKKVDIMFYPLKETKNISKSNLVKTGELIYFYRKDIKEDLRFATLNEAFKKLSSSISKQDLDILFANIQKNGKHKRLIKEFFIERKMW